MVTDKYVVIYSDDTGDLNERQFDELDDAKAFILGDQ